MSLDSGTHRICSAEIKELIVEIAKALGTKAHSHIFPMAQAVANKIAHNLQNIILYEVWIHNVQMARYPAGGDSYVRSCVHFSSQSLVPLEICVGVCDRYQQ